MTLASTTGRLNCLVMHRLGKGQLLQLKIDFIVEKAVLNGRHKIPTRLTLELLAGREIAFNPLILYPSR